MITSAVGGAIDLCDFLQDAIFTLGRPAVKQMFSSTFLLFRKPSNPHKDPVPVEPVADQP